jgi:hypothetical protein
VGGAPAVSRIEDVEEDLSRMAPLSKTVQEGSHQTPAVHLDRLFRMYGVRLARKTKQFCLKEAGYIAMLRDCGLIPQVMNRTRAMVGYLCFPGFLRVLRALAFTAYICPTTVNSPSC